MGIDVNRERAIDLAVSQIEKQFGKGAIMKLGEDALSMDVPSLPTGSLGLDIALGIGGIPRGRVVEIYGPESSGKTTLAPLGFPPEARAFSAHVTIGRVRSPRGARALAPAIEAAGAVELGAWTAPELVLYESRLGPAGALHVPVSRHRLRGRRP